MHWKMRLRGCIGNDLRPYNCHSETTCTGCWDVLCLNGMIGWPSLRTVSIHQVELEQIRVHHARSCRIDRCGSFLLGQSTCTAYWGGSTCTHDLYNGHLTVAHFGKLALMSTFFLLALFYAYEDNLRSRKQICVDALRSVTMRSYEQKGCVQSFVCQNGEGRKRRRFDCMKNSEKKKKGRKK
jgi:hypothetical protein